MKYYSLNRNSAPVSFEEAAFLGLAPDGGLYFPELIPKLSQQFFDSIQQYSDTDIAFEVIRQFVGDEIPPDELKQIIDATLSFDFPLVAIDKDIYTLELFHGPTMAFKDVGARFMSGCLAYFNRNRNRKSTILVATSGDTGGAVANGFLGIEGIDVVILYPAGKVSDIQERQLTTLGQNVTALRVDGVFDDCQDMVKKAFQDRDLALRNLTSANSINVARWLPQMIYFFIAYKKLQSTKPIVISCPSGNFGNICAGVLAKKMGLPIAKLIAATNVNDTVPEFMVTAKYQPKPSQPTISNAMDVGNPSNFIRILELYGNNIRQLRTDFCSYSFTDDETVDAMQALYRDHNYIADPHGAVGYLGLKKEMKENNAAVGIFLETAHPIKFAEIVENAIGRVIDMPVQIRSILDKQKEFIAIANYSELKSFLLRSIDK